MNENIDIKRDERKILPLIWSGKEAQIDFNINLSGPGAEVTLLMLLLGKDASRLILRTNIVHLSPNTKSRVIIKGALGGASQVDFEGLSKISPGSKNSDTWLAAHLLLLSDTATGRAVPKLEISDNEVKAGHASTVGKVSEPELFYLMSRGLTQKTATRLIVEGFLESLLREFPDKLAQNARKELKWL